MNNEKNDLQTLFVRELREMYDAEHQLVKGLAELELCANSRKLKTALYVHLAQTRHHVTRLEKVFQEIGEPVDRRPCLGIEGIIDEAELLAKEFTDNSALDAALVMAAQKAEHYEMVCYERLCSWARQLGHDSALKWLQKNLKEEKQADLLLTGLAKWSLNPEARRHDTRKEPESAAALGKLVAFGD